MLKNVKQEPGPYRKSREWLSETTKTLMRGYSEGTRKHMNTSSGPLAHEEAFYLLFYSVWYININLHFKWEDGKHIAFIDFLLWPKLSVHPYRIREEYRMAAFGSRQLSREANSWDRKHQRNSAKDAIRITIGHSRWY
jgi:hypothetical protein